MSRSIAYLGPRASYTHQAALALLALNSAQQDPPRLESLPNIPSLFSTIQAGQHLYAICPAENSSNGPVGATLDLVATAASKHPKVVIVGELRVRVRHCLIVRGDGHSEQALPESFSSGESALTTATLARLSKIDTLATHPQAWTQCSHFLAYLDGLRETTSCVKPRRVDSLSTSGAAQSLIDKASQAQPDGNEGTSAAISSALAADLDPCLQVLLTGLEDSKDNVTRFYVLAHRDVPNPLGLCLVEQPCPGGVTRKAIMSFTLTKAGEGAADSKPRPGALARALATFERHQLNLTSIAARPSGYGAWNYTFVVEVEVPGGVDSELAVLDATVQDLTRLTGGEARVGGLWSWNEDWSC